MTVIGHEQWDLSFVVRQVTHSFNEFRYCIVETPTDGRHDIVWRAPPEGWVKVNVDGSVNLIKRVSGFGGVFRNFKGEWLCGFTAGSAIKDALRMELEANKYGLLLAWDRGFRMVYCETDCLVAFNLLHSQLPLLELGLRPILQEINDLINRNWRVLVSHVLRTGNMAADFMAKLGANGHRDMSIWLSPPIELEAVLYSDLSH